MKLWTVLVVWGGVSLSGVQRVLEIVGKSLGISMPIVDYATGRSWIIRLGLDSLRHPLEKTQDWIWITDHTVQIGKMKILLIVGVRASALPPVGQPLCASDLQLISLLPMEQSNAITVHEALKQAAERTGVPRAILSDHGADLLAGIRLWIAEHPETVEIYDIAHKAACLLKNLLGDDPRWAEFIKLASTAKNQMAQTELGGLLPPSLRDKARFMNLKSLIDWGLKMLKLLKRTLPLNQVEGCTPRSLVECNLIEFSPRQRSQIAGVSAKRLHEKLGWLMKYELALREWNEWLQLIDITLNVIRLQGHSLRTPWILDQSVPLPLRFESSDKLFLAFREFISEASGALPVFERLPGSSEILESIFGKFKRIERQQSRGGFTSLILSIGMLVGRPKDQHSHAIGEALERTGIKHVVSWITENLGMTVSSQRRLATEAAK